MATYEGIVCGDVGAGRSQKRQWKKGREVGRKEVFMACSIVDWEWYEKFNSSAAVVWTNCKSLGTSNARDSTFTTKEKLNIPRHPVYPTELGLTTQDCGGNGINPALVFEFILTAASRGSMNDMSITHTYARTRY